MPAILRQCLNMLPAPLRWRWAALLPLLIVAAALEAAGAAGIFTLMHVLQDPTQASAVAPLSRLSSALPWHGDQAIILACTTLIALFYLGKNALTAATLYCQYMLTATSAVTLARRMLHGYLQVPYAFHFHRNSAELIRNATDSSEAVFRLTVGASINIAAEGCVLLSLVSVLLATAPVVTLLAVAVLSLVVAGLVKGTRRTILRLGAREQELKHGILKSLQEIFGGLKEIKVLGRESFFFQDFSTRHRRLSRSRARYLTLSSLPRLLVETIFVGGMLLVITLLTLSGEVSADLIPTLGLYAYAGFRVIPSVNRIIVNLTNIRYGSAATTRLHKDLVLFRQLGLDTDPAIESENERTVSLTKGFALEHVSFTYEGSVVPTLHDITLAIRRGESVGIVGPTGAGKSTLLDILLGLLMPSSGRFTSDGSEVAQALRSWQGRIGYVPQQVFLTDDTIRRNIALGLSDEVISESCIANALRLAQLEEFVGSLPHGLDTLVGERGIRLSGGQRQRIAIARALYHDPELLIFDEATSALDTATEHEVMHAIEALRGKKTLLIVAHRLSTVQACDRVVRLQEGRIVDK